MTRKVRSLLPRRRLQVQDVQKTDAVRNYRPVVVEPIKYKPKADEVVINLPGQKPRIVKRRNEVVYADNRSNVQRQLDQKKDKQIRQRYQQQKNKQAAEEGVNAMMKLVSPSTYVGAAARSLTGDGTFVDNLVSGTGFDNPTANIVFDVASPFMLKSGISALSKYALNPAYNSLRNRVVSSMLNRNVRNWDGTVGMEYFNSPNNWYRWTETPEIEGIREVGKNVTTRDAVDINIPSNNWRTAAMDNYSKSKEGYWYKADKPDEDMPLRKYLDYLKNNTNKPIGSGKKYGSAHGNKSQAAYGKAWNGSLSTSGIGQLGLLEGQAGIQIPFGKNRTSFTLTPIEEVPIGGRIGFSTGEMPLDNLGWFTKLPNGRFRYQGEVLPYKRIDLTPKTSISKEEVDVPFKGKLQNYLTESGESMIYDNGQYVLKEKSLYDVNSSIDKLHQSVSRDLAMNQIPGVQPIEYLGYKINTNPQKTINGLTGEVEVKLNKTYDPIYRQRKLIPLDDPKTKFIYQPDPYRLLDRWGIKHDKDFGNVGAIKFSDFGLNNWGIDTYGRYRLFDPMIHDF